MLLISQLQLSSLWDTVRTGFCRCLPGYGLSAKSSGLLRTMDLALFPRSIAKCRGPWIQMVFTLHKPPDQVH